MRAIADATPLIHLAKIGKLHLLKRLFEKIIIETEVYKEVIEKGGGHNEVSIIKKLMEEKFITVKESARKIEMSNLHEGEKKSISLCLNLNVKNILIDEGEGVNAATMLGLIPIRTTTLLIILLDKGLIHVKEYEDAIHELLESGYFLDASTYARLLKIGKGIVKDK